jgi:hypothetical protein
VSALETALALAAQGFPVFPCGRNKRPSIPGGRGFHDATTDADQIRSLFGRSGELVGCPTGAITGFDVLDFDYEHGAAQWEQENLYRLPQTRIHRTQSGGRHYLFRHAPGVRNTASKIAPGIDIRGEGGYVILPPSVGYEVINDADLAEWPDWLLELIFSKPPPPRTNGYHHQPISSARLDGFIRAVVGRVTAAGEGGKHFALRNAALSIGGIQVAAGLSDAQAKQMLIHALPQTVKDWRNADHTIEWGLAHGRERPLELEDREPPKRNGHAGAYTQEAPPKPQEFDADLFKLEYFHDIQPPTETQDFVEGLLIASTMCVIYGESNSGKTFFATDLFLHVACGWAWNGREVERGAVIYCALEGAHGIRNRIVAFREEHGLGSHDIPFAVIPVTMDLLKPNADISKLIATVQAEAKKLSLPIRAVVIDTLSRAMAGGNENAPDDMGLIVTHGTRIQQETQALVCWIHHSGKDQARGARGHSLLRAATETEIEIIDNDGIRTATVTKQRDLECSGVFNFRLKPVEIGTDRRGKPITSCVVAPEAEPTTPSSTARAVRKLTGHAKRAFEVLTDLCASEGRSGDAGVPQALPSVPEEWWRERFYARTPSDSTATKQKAFKRASLDLINSHIVGMANNRVWIAIKYEPSGPDIKPDISPDI